MAEGFALGSRVGWEDKGQVSWYSLPTSALPQVALDMVEEICAEMALTRPEAFNEYVIFVVTNRGEWPGKLTLWGSFPSPGLSHVESCTQSGAIFCRKPWTLVWKDRYVF